MNALFSDFRIMGGRQGQVPEKQKSPLEVESRELLLSLNEKVRN
jgi:hypothetical protein